MGGLYNNSSPMICGGIDGQNIISACYILNQNTWTSVQSISVPRYAASMTKYPSAKSTSVSDLIVIGGENSGPGFLSTLEVYGTTEWVSINAQFPEGIMWGCAITVNETTILMTGGRTDSQANVTSETFWFESTTEKWSPGPQLNIPRRCHGCGMIQDPNEGVFLIVASGYNGSAYLDSTEILEPGSNEWKQGPKLPIPIDEARMVEDSNKNRVLLIGGKDSNGPLDKIFQLSSPLTITSQWEELPQKLQIGRKCGSVAFVIPDHFTDCQENEYDHQS